MAPRLQNAAGKDRLRRGLTGLDCGVQAAREALLRTSKMSGRCAAALERDREKADDVVPERDHGSDYWKSPGPRGQFRERGATFCGVGQERARKSGDFLAL